MRKTYQASCTCGQVSFDANGEPILSATCYCKSCRSAGQQFEMAIGAPTVLRADGGTDYCLYRKDRVMLARGADHLREHRLSGDTPTRRVVASCCNTPMFLDFTKGHWLTLYRDRLGPGAPRPEMGVMAKDKPSDQATPADMPVHANYPPSFMVRILIAWAKMGLRRPPMTW
jgi:hypothetical protein